jgi:hypothetical protein
LLRIGKKLTIVLAFNYRSEDDDHSATASTRVDKRGRVSATSRMLAEREAYIADEEERTGRTATWSAVYDRMRCTGVCVCEFIYADPSLSDMQHTTTVNTWFLRHGRPAERDLGW